MSYISVAQYASPEDTKKVLRVLKVFKSNISRN